jgi:hypothetical protein
VKHFLRHLQEAIRPTQRFSSQNRTASCSIAHCAASNSRAPAQAFLSASEVLRLGPFQVCGLVFSPPTVPQGAVFLLVHSVGLRPDLTYQVIFSRLCLLQPVQLFQDPPHRLSSCRNLTSSASCACDSPCWLCAALPPASPNFASGKCGASFCCNQTICACSTLRSSTALTSYPAS